MVLLGNEIQSKESSVLTIQKKNCSEVNGDYCVEASDIRYNGERIVVIEDIEYVFERKAKDMEGETLYWLLRGSNNTTLTIFND